MTTKLSWREPKAPASAMPARVRSAFARFFAVGLVAATTVGGGPASGTNINALNHNNTMTGRMLQPPAEAETPVQQLAVQAISAFRDYIYTGDRKKADEFTRLCSSNQTQAFGAALDSEMKRQVVDDPKLGSIVNAYRDANGGKFYASEFMSFVSTVRDAALSNNPDRIREVADPSLDVVPGFSKNVVEPLIKVCQQGQSPAAQAEMQDNAFETASKFIALLDTVKIDVTKRPTLATLREQARKSEEARGIARDILGQFRANTAADGSFQPGFLDSFDKVLREQCPECVTIVAGFAADRGVTPGKLAYKDFADMFDRVPKLFNQLLAPGNDFDALSRAYGSGLTGAVRSYLAKVATPVEEVASTQALQKRVAEVEQFVKSRDIWFVQVGTEKKPETLGSVIEDWKKRLAANPDREARLALHGEIPGVEMLQDVEAHVIRDGRMSRAVLDGNNDFYRTIGTKEWVPRLQTLVTDLKQQTNENITGKFATALIARENLDVKALEDLAIAALNTNTEIAKSLSTLDEQLRTSPLDNERARLDAVAQMFTRNGQINKDIDALTDRMEIFYPKMGREALRAQIADRLMVQYVVPVAGMDPVEALRARYDAMAKDKAFLSFRNNFASDITRYISSLATAPARPADQQLNQQRQEMAINARALFESTLLAGANTDKVRTLLSGINVSGTSASALKADLSNEAGRATSLDNAILNTMRSVDVINAIRTEFGAQAATSYSTAVASATNAGQALAALPASMSSFVAAVKGLQGNSTLDAAFVKAKTDAAQQGGATMPMEYAYGIYGMVRDVYGKNWTTTMVGNNTAMAKVCALASGFSKVPAPYASSILGTVGETLMGTYDDASIAIIADYIAGVSQMFVQGDYQHFLIRYYNELPDRVKGLFTNITAMQAERREKGYSIQTGKREPVYDVRIMTPAEDPNFRDIYMPAANIRVRVPKRIYEEWTTIGILQVARAPNLVDVASFSPNFLNVMSTFMDKSMLEGTVNLPMPYISLPILMQDLGLLAPDNLPPVGERIGWDFTADVTVDHQYTAVQNATTSATTTTINAAQNFAREGATTTAKEAYSINEGTGTETEQVGTVDVQNLRVGKNYNVNTFDFNFDQIGSRLQTIGTVFSAIAPKGAETAIAFKRNQTPEGDVTLNAQIYQRAANGSFVLSDALTLSAAEAQQMYEQAFAKPVQRLYAAGRLMPASGDVIGQMDGAVLFSGAFTSDYTTLDQFQGAGAAFQAHQWGGYTDYEQTRSGRAAGAFGHFMPDKRAFWIGRLTAENVRVETDGRRKFYGEFAYTQTDESEVRGFLGFAKNMSADDMQGAFIANRMFGHDVVGMHYGGVGVGRLITENADAIETMGGGRIYGVSRDLLSGMVASAVYNTYAQKTQAEAQAPVTLTPEAQSFYNQNVALTSTLRQIGANDQARQKLFQLLTSTNPTDIQTYTRQGITVSSDNTVTLGPNSAQWLRTYTQQAGAATTQQALQNQVTSMLVSAGVRKAISSQLDLETGAGWDVLNNQGAAMMNFDWTPLSDHVSDVGLRAYFITQDARVIPIVGGTTGLVPLPRTKLTGEAYYPGIGELRMRTPFFEFALGGGEIKDVSGGAHLGLRVPLGSRWSLGAATSLSSDYLKSEARRMDQQEGIAGAIFTMPYSSKAGFRLANVFGSLSFIHQNQDVLAVAYGQAREWDASAGLNWLTARSSLTGTLGTQYWEATRGEELHSMYSLTAGLQYSLKTMKASPTFILINPALTTDVSIGTENVETASDKSARLNLRVNIRGTTEF